MVKSFYKSAVALQPTAPDMTQIEYFLDADPGIGNGVNVPITAAINIQDLNFDIDIHALSVGFHRLFVRAYNQNGAWSLVANKPFLNSPNEVSPLYPITKAEYFFDTDPGFGLGTDIGLASATDIPTLNFSPNVAGLSIGRHTLYTRSRITTMDGTQRWSQTANRPFYRAAVETASALPNLTRIEYFVDFDPGFGNGTAVSFTAGTTVAALNFDIDVSGLSNGHHRLFTRSRDANGRWSETTASIFAVNQPLPEIDRVEYFVDDGSVINVPVTSSVDIANFNFNVNVEALSEGFHKLSIRSRNTKSEWSEVTIKSFYKGVSPLSILPNIDKVEYFVDTDPGFGNGRNVPVTAATDITSNNFNVSMGGLTSGLHKLYVRSRDVNGLWSETNGADFTNNANIAMTVKVFLQGAYDVVSHTMTDNLRNLALIPTTEPYTGLGFTHVNGGGNEQATSTAFDVNGDNSVVDWVFLELRDATNSTIVVATQSALLQKDGDIVAKDGVSTLEWSGVAEGCDIL